MDINAGIIDQRLDGIVTKYESLLPAGLDNQRKKTTAFVLLCIAAFLDMPLDEASNYLTDGGNDAGIDGLYIGEPDDGEFTVILFQGKYKTSLTADSNFPESEIIKIINTISLLFDPKKNLELNPKIKPYIEEIRSRIKEGYIPFIRVLLCNNGAKWNDNAQKQIDNTGFGDQVSWEYHNHDDLVMLLRPQKKINTTLKLQGRAIVEDFNFRRVLIGKIPVTEIADLFKAHDDSLLERNIRRYLGLHTNRVNKAIHETLKSKSENFYFFNNGITMICKKFRHNALQGEDYQIKIDEMQIINGGQTCKTILETIKSLPDANFDQVCVLLRLYELTDEDRNFTNEITFATNSQNPVDLRDLHSNDTLQLQLETGIADLPGSFSYKRHRDTDIANPSMITPLVVAEAVMAIWREKPHQAKFYRKQHFGKLYDEIFNGLNAAQAVLAVLIFRIVENERKRPVAKNPPSFLPYASHYIAMLMGRALLLENKLKQKEISHKNFQMLCERLETQKIDYYKIATEQIDTALKDLYGEKNPSLQLLSGTFRRGDLLDKLTVNT
jgi:hypothetical protein